MEYSTFVHRKRPVHPQLESIIFELSKSCNLKCRHCYLFPRSEKWRSSQDKLNANLIESTVKAAIPLGLRMCTFTGGEALLRTDIIDILNRCFALGVELNLFSNLTLLNNDHVKVFKDLKVNLVSTSLDGFEKNHDSFRGQRGAFRKTVNAIDKLVAAGIKVKVVMTVTPNNVNDIPDLLSYLNDANIITSITRIIPIGRGKHFENDANLNKDYIDLLIHNLRNIFINCQRNKLDQLNLGRSYCGVGTCMLCILSDGRISYCPILSPDENPRWLIGNIIESNIADIWDEGRIFNNNKLQCKNINTCEYSEFCRGGCRADAYFQSGDLYSCDYMLRYAFEKLTNLYHNRSDVWYPVT